MQKMIFYLIGSRNEKFNDQVVITADTILELPGNLKIGKLGGEHDPLKATLPIEKLKIIINAGQNTPIKVHTAYVLLNSISGEMTFDTDTALLRFNALDESLSESERIFIKELIKNDAQLSSLNDFSSKKLYYQDILIQYVKRGLHEGKAGGFDIRDRDFFLCIKDIEGDPTTIIGLPCVKLSRRMSVSVKMKAIIKSIWPTEFEQEKIRM
jgi:predicted house-cleaning NTP pyrophosphatase (Maf/HAM1 superfamily)